MAGLGQDKTKKTAVGAQIPAGIKPTQAAGAQTSSELQQAARDNQDSVNGGLAANDPAVIDHHALQGGAVPSDQRKPPKVVLAEDGSIMTDAPPPPKPRPPKMRKVEQANGTRLGPGGEVLPGIYTITREREKPNGDIVKTTHIRQDN